MKGEKIITFIKNHLEELYKANFYSSGDFVLDGMLDLLNDADLEQLANTLPLDFQPETGFVNKIKDTINEKLLEHKNEVPLSRKIQIKEKRLNDFIKSEHKTQFLTERLESNSYKFRKQAYDILDSVWNKLLEKKVERAWEFYRDPECGKLIIKHGDVNYIADHEDELKVLDDDTFVKVLIRETEIKDSQELFRSERVCFCDLLLIDCYGKWKASPKKREECVLNMISEVVSYYLEPNTEDSWMHKYDWFYTRRQEYCSLFNVYDIRNSYLALLHKGALELALKLALWNFDLVCEYKKEVHELKVSESMIDFMLLVAEKMPKDYEVDIDYYPHELKALINEWKRTHDNRKSNNDDGVKELIDKLGLEPV